MSKMRRVISGLTVGVFCFLSALVASAQDAKNKEGYLSVPIGTIELTAPQGIDAAKSPVEFPHAVHFTYTCTTCHHTWNLDADLKSCTASECHDLTKTPNNEAGSAGVADIRYFKRAYHENCIGCHQEIKRQNAAKEKGWRLSDKDLTLQKSGPTGCVECHPRD